MQLNGKDWAAIAVIAGAGCAAIYAGLARAMRRAVAKRQRETDRQLSALAMRVKALEARVAELGRPQAAEAGRSEAAALNAAADSETESKPRPEIMATIAAAATAFLGKTARIRSVQPLPADQDGAGAWAQQGRVIVQTSHNLRPRG